jgi:hypothetical protein
LDSETALESLRLTRFLRPTGSDFAGKRFNDQERLPLHG